MFAGSYPLTIDDKGRLAIPARFRAEVVEQCGSQLYITRSYQPCIEIYPAPAFHRVVEEIKVMPNRTLADTLSRIFIGNAVDTEMDKQGRLLLPAVLRKTARLENEAVLVGQIDRFDLWPEPLWQQKLGEGADVAALQDAFASLKR